MITRRRFLGGVAVGVTSAAAGRAAAEAPPETTTIRLARSAAICFAPIYVAGDGLLQAEGFQDVRYVSKQAPDGRTLQAAELLAAGEAELGAVDVSSALAQLDRGAPILVIAGLHSGCYELFGSGPVRAIRDLKGRRVGVPGLHTGRHLTLSAMIAHVGLDPSKDVTWATQPPAEGMALLAEGKIDAFLGFPPEPQELRRSKVGRLIVSMTRDRPWAEYFCCMVVARRDFAQRHPVATKRALRAILKAAGVCTTDPERAAGVLLGQRLTDQREHTLEMLRELPYGRWRDYNPADTLRFYGLRLHEAGLIKAPPSRLIAQGADWRALEELRKELKA